MSCWTTLVLYFDNVSTFGVEKLLRQMIMYSLISSQTQNLFKFAASFYGITHINIWVIKATHFNVLDIRPDLEILIGPSTHTSECSTL